MATTLYEAAIIYDPKRNLPLQYNKKSENFTPNYF